MASKLSHPNIVTVYEASLSMPTPYIASAWCDGPNLAEWIEKQTVPPNWRECVSFIAEIADAVEYAHSQGVYHRDLKPANIFVGEEACGRGEQCWKTVGL